MGIEASPELINRITLNHSITDNLTQLVSACIRKHSFRCTA